MGNKRLTDGQKPNPATGGLPPKGAEIFRKERQPDDADPRAKTTGHGKKTADKWNQ
jgi:hypothetical protein